MGKTSAVEDKACDIPFTHLTVRCDIYDAPDVGRGLAPAEALGKRSFKRGANHLFVGAVIDRPPAEAFIPYLRFPLSNMPVIPRATDGRPYDGVSLS